MDFQEARRYGDALALSAFIIAQGPNRQGRDERRMIGHDAQVAVQCADEDEIHIFMEYGSIGCNDGSLTLAIKENRCEASKMAYFFVKFFIFFLSNV